MKIFYFRKLVSNFRKIVYSFRKIVSNFRKIVSNFRKIVFNFLSCTMGRKDLSSESTNSDYLIPLSLQPIVVDLISDRIR